ncbi:MAG: hypothetical protein JW734_08125 [Candidatus Omnitrophica bacterium]|nr:hypothetical protein [Candidatus Omnitrophota bacterium]
MKKFLIFFFILFFFTFAHLYQKVKIVILAYQVHDKRAALNNLVEEKYNFVYNFYKEANLATLNARLADEDVDLNYPREYVKVVVQKELDKASRARSESLLAKILGFASRVEARP